jgi:hypothetical protein
VPILAAASPVKFPDAQAILNKLGADIADIQNMYAEGRCTMREYVDLISKIKVNVDLTGLTDPISGMQYPSREDLANFEKCFL